MRVFLGMSGGVDSSVSAYLLKQQGHEVIGIYMKNWTKSLPGFECPWRDDLLDAKRVAVQLGIDFRIYDFQKEYKKKVVDYLIDSYKSGLTPNPDIMCNQDIKFGLFADTAFSDGAEAIATGHYARTKDGRLYTAKDKTKDQTYFLYRVGGDVLSRTLFHLGDYTKEEVRQIAEKQKLATASKSESMGICFVGKVDIKEFLKQYIKTKPGKIISNGKEVGKHEGAIFYTIGQRQGLDIGGGLPYYVCGKDVGKNEVYVTRDIDHKDLWAEGVKLTSTHWINTKPNSGEYLVRSRHLGKLVKANYSNNTLKFKTPLRALAPGQSAVMYRGDEVVGGGIISQAI